MSKDGLTQKRRLIAEWRTKADADAAMAETAHAQNRGFYQRSAANLRVMADQLEANLPAEVSPPFEGEIPDSSEPEA